MLAREDEARADDAAPTQFDVLLACHDFGAHLHLTAAVVEADGKTRSGTRFPFIAIMKGLHSGSSRNR